MTQDEIVGMLAAVDFQFFGKQDWNIFDKYEAFAQLVAEKEREVVANWIMDKGFATGHGDSIVDLLDQLEWQIAEKEREACAETCEGVWLDTVEAQNHNDKCVKAIRARGQE